MAVISKNNTTNRTLTSAACWEPAPDTGVARVPLTTDSIRWYSASNAGGNHTGSLTVLGVQVDGATADITHTSGTLTLTQTDAFVNAVQSNRAWIANGGVIALGASARNFKLNRTGGPAVVIAGAAGLTGTNTLTLSNTSGLADYNYAIFAANGAQAGFTGSIVLLDYTALANWTSAAAATLTGCNVTVDGVGCLIGTYINGATIGASGKTLTINNNMLLGGGGSAITIAYAVALGSVTRTLTVNSNTTMSGTVTGTAGVTVNLGSASTFLYLSTTSSGLSGPCTVNTGRFAVGAPSSSQSTRYAPSTLVVNAGSTFEYFGSDAFNFPSLASGGAAANPTGTGAIAVAGSHSGTGCTFVAGTLTGFLGLIGTRPLSDNAAFTAPRVVVHELPGGFQWVCEATGALTVNAQITYASANPASNSTKLILDSANNTNSVALTAGTYALIVPDTAGAVTLTGTVQRTNTAGTASARMSLTLGGSNTGDNTLSGVISETASPLNGAILGITKVDAGRWVLSGNSSHTGIHTISAGTLSAQSATALGSATSAGGVSITGTGKLELSGGITLNKSSTPFTIHSSSPIVSIGDNTLQTAGITLGGTTTFEVTTGNRLAIVNSGAITDSTFTHGLTKTGDGELSLAAFANTYDGTVTVSAGTLAFGSSGSLGTGNVQVAGNLKYTGTGETYSRSTQLTSAAPSLEASGTGALEVTNLSQNTATKTLTLKGTNTAANKIIGNLANNTGTLSLAKEGTGKWVLPGVLSYTGTTTVSGGTLRIETANSNTTSGAVTIGASGTVELITDTLASSGATAGEVLGTGNVTVNGGTIKTRGGVTQKGQVRYGGNLTFTGNSTLYIGGAAAA